MKRYGNFLLFVLLFVISRVAFADIVVPIYLVAQKGGEGQSIGTVTIKQEKCGLLFVPNLSGLTPGVHGFHIHQNPSCDNFANAAGDHYDPQNTSQHQGPYATGHMGDLPILVVDKDGKATLPGLAPRLTLAAIKGHSLMIHKFSDNYSDAPEKNGGGGPRIACGVIQ